MATQLSADPLGKSDFEMSTAAANRRGLCERIGHLIDALGAGEDPGVRASMHNRRWRQDLATAGVDSGQLSYADNLVDDAHSILRRQPENIAGVIGELERAREKLV